MLRRYANTTQTLTKLRVGLEDQDNKDKLSVEYAGGSGTYALRSQKYKLSQLQKEVGLGCDVLVPVRAIWAAAIAVQNAL